MLSFYLQRLCLINAVIILLTACLSNNDRTNNRVPSPSEMKVDIDVNGRVSTLNHIEIKHVGKQIPYTYSDGKIANSPNFDWWVSKHFAIKSDLPFEKVKLYLELLEMSYPHYVELFGQQPPNIERQRIAVVYGSSRAKVKDTMFDDGFLRGVHEHAGGETMYYNRAGYSFPSQREQHQRYIVIHETMHAFHMALNGHSTWAPYWITEGLADSIAHHVYDSKKKQLTVMVFDRAPMNYVKTGLEQYQELNQPSMEQINAHPSLKRGLNFLMTHYLLSTPELNHKYKLFIAKLMAANPHSEQTVPVTNQILKEVYDNWQAVEAGFTEFVANSQSSFEIVNGPWEQDGNQYWIRQYDHQKTAQLNISLSAQNKPAPHPRKFDFPAPDLPVSLKLSSPTDIGFILEYLPEHIRRGKNGIGFNLGEKESLFQILVVEGRTLDVLNPMSGKSAVSFKLNTDLIQAIKQNQQVMAAVMFAEDRLKIKLQSANQQQTFDIELEPNQVALLARSPLALLANNNNNRITPFFQENRAPQLSRVVTGSNIFGSRNAKKLVAVIALCKTPACDIKLKGVYQLIESNKTNEADLLISQLYDSLYLTSAEEKQLFSPLKTSIEHHKKRPFVRIDNLLDKLDATLKVSYYDAEQIPLNTHMVNTSISSGINNFDIEPPENAAYIQANIQFRKDFNLSSESTISAVKAFDGVEIEINKLSDNISVSLSGPYSGPTKGELTVRLLNTSDGHRDLGTKDVIIEPYQTLDFDFEIDAKTLKTAGRESWTVEATAILDVDGEDIKLSKTLRI